MSRMIAGVYLLVAAVPVWAAGGHYPVDDTSIAEPGQVQVEMWMARTNAENRELAILPAASLGDSLQLSAGMLRLREGGDSVTRLEPAAKYLLPGSNLYGIDFAISLTAGFSDGRLEDWLLNLPASYALNDAVGLHANVGWLRLREGEAGNLDRLFTGLAGEWTVNDGVGVIAQFYRQGAEEQPEAQLGFRFASRGAFQHVDLAIGRALRGDERDWFVTLGLALVF